jgi:hypothetical protein
MVGRGFEDLLRHCHFHLHVGGRPFWHGGGDGAICFYTPLELWLQL